MIKKQDESTPDPIKPDLKHDTMEYAASRGEDVPLQPGELLDEDDDLTAEELDMLEGDDIDDEAAALISAETDSQADEDNFLMEPEEPEDEYPGDEGDDKNEEN